MRAIVCSAFGPPEGLAVEERRDPVPRPGQVLVRHRAWGLNYVDILMCAGGYQLKPELPFVPGLGGSRRCDRPGRRSARRCDRRPCHDLGTSWIFLRVDAVDAADVLPVPVPFGYAEGRRFDLPI